MSKYDYATIVTTGTDATEFLQGQLTADLGSLGPGDRGLAAWCNPKGRVICVFRVTRTDAGFRLALPAEMAEGTLRRLTMFRFRSKVDFELAPATPEDLGTNDAIDRWRLDNLRNGIPEIGLDQTEKFTPHMLNLDLLDAISLDKGCYTGQEVVARTHYRGATKRRTLRFESESPVETGAKIAASGRDVGEVLNVAGTDLLAVISVDSAGEPLSVEGTGLKRVTLPYEP